MIKTIKTAFFLLATFQMALAYSFDSVDTATAEKMIKEGSVVLLDVRTPQEFAEGHLNLALNKDYQSPHFAEEVNLLDKGKTYLLYCRSGRRSALAAEQMQNLGFQKIYNMQGGIVKWISEARPVQK